MTRNAVSEGKLSNNDCDGLICICFAAAYPLSIFLLAHPVRITQPDIHLHVLDFLSDAGRRGALLGAGRLLPEVGGDRRDVRRGLPRGGGRLPVRGLQGETQVCKEE